MQAVTELAMNSEKFFPVLHYFSMRVPGRAVEYISPFLLDFWRHTYKCLYSDQKFYHTGHVAGKAGMNPKLGTHEEPLVHHVILYCACTHIVLQVNFHFSYYGDSTD